MRAVRQHRIDRQHVLARVAVTQRARAAGIVADHAADRGARGGGNIDRKPQPRGFQLAIELIEHDARLDHAAAIDGIDLEHIVEMARAVDHDRCVDGLSGLRGAAAARRHRHALGAANRDRAVRFRDRARGHDTERHDLIMRGVGGIAPTREHIETHLAGLFGLEAAFEYGSQNGRHFHSDSNALQPGPQARFLRSPEVAIMICLLRCSD